MRGSGRRCRWRCSRSATGGGERSSVLPDFYRMPGFCFEITPRRRRPLMPDYPPLSGAEIDVLARAGVPVEALAIGEDDVC